MKPGNLRKRGAKSGGKTRDEGLIGLCTSGFRCAFLLPFSCYSSFFEVKKGNKYGKKTVYI